MFKGECSHECQAGTYDNGDFSCELCQFPCSQCSSLGACHQCLGGYLLYRNSTCIADVQRCPNDYFKMDSLMCVPRSWCPAEYYVD